MDQNFKKGTHEVVPKGKDDIQKIPFKVSFKRCVRFL